MRGCGSGISCRLSLGEAFETFKIVRNIETTVATAIVSAIYSSITLCFLFPHAQPTCVVVSRRQDSFLLFL